MSTSLEQIHFDVMRYRIARYLSNQDVAALSGSSFTLHQAYSGQAAEALLTHVVRGEEEQARSMIVANPRLLLIKAKTQDYSGRTIDGTAFQAALGAEDSRMWQMMKPYFSVLEEKGTIKSAKETMRAQFDAQFPNGITDTPATELQPFYNALAKAIIEDKDNGDAAIAGFRKVITKNNHTSTPGKHFNMQHLLAAYQAYSDNFESLSTWPNRDKFWQKVIGYVQRQMPANYAQVHCSGVVNVLLRPAEFKRTLRFSNHEEFFPLAVDSGMGFDFGCFSSSFGGGVNGPRSYYGGGGDTLEIYLGQIQGSLESFGEALSQSSQSGINITV